MDETKKSFLIQNLNNTQLPCPRF